MSLERSPFTDFPLFFNPLTKIIIVLVILAPLRERREHFHRRIVEVSET